MNEPARITALKHAVPAAELDGFEQLAQLALDMRSSWNHAADSIWRQLDQKLWDLTQNPWALLQAVSRDKLEQLLREPSFRKSVDDLLQARREAAAAPAWFQK